MNLEEQRVIGTNQIHVSDSLAAPLLKAKLTNLANTIIPSENELIVYVDKHESTTPTDERKQFVFELESPLQYLDETSDEFNLEITVKNNDIILQAYVERKIGINETVKYLLSDSTLEEIDGFLINLFEGDNYIYTNYTNASLEIIYSKNDDLNKRFLNNAIYYNHKINNDGEFGLDDIYFKDAFTKTEDKLNLEVNNAKVECITSKNNKFSLDENGNLVVNSITANSGLTYDDTSICDLIYPVGSIYLSVNSTDPNLLFGGTWYQMKDRFLLGAGDIYNANSTGGEASHILTTDEIPNHNHGSKGLTGSFVSRAMDSAATVNKILYCDGIVDRENFSGTQGYYNTANRVKIDDQYNKVVIDATHTHENVGSGLAHNNMPPYTTVYIWKRIA